MAGCCQELTGRTERQTLMMDLAWAAGWLKDIAQQLKATQRLVEATSRALTDRGAKTAEEQAAVMMLNGCKSAYRDKFVERDGDSFIDTLNGVIDTAERLENIGRGRTNIPVYGPDTVDPYMPVEDFDQQMLEQYIREIMSGTEHIQEIFAKYGMIHGVTVQVHMKVVDTNGNPVIVKGLDPVPTIQKFLAEKAKRDEAKRKQLEAERKAELEKEAQTGRLPGPGTPDGAEAAMEPTAPDGEDAATDGLVIPGNKE